MRSLKVLFRHKKSHFREALRSWVYGSAAALALVMGLSLFSSSLVQAYVQDRTSALAHEVPEDLEGVGITERLGESLDLSLEFVDDRGESILLGDLFDGKKPVLFTIIYYSCPSLCNFHLNGVTEAMKQMDWSVGEQFRIVALTMNHHEDWELAAAKKASYVEAYGRPESAGDWHFLTGTEENILAAADQVGFGFRWNEAQQQFAHAAAAIILTPAAEISRYLYGIGFSPNTLRMSLLEASNGKIGSFIDQVILFCFQFDPSKNEYTLYAYNIMRAGGVLVVFALAIFLIPAWRRERRLESGKSGSVKES